MCVLIENEFIEGYPCRVTTVNSVLINNNWPLEKRLLPGGVTP